MAAIKAEFDVNRSRGQNVYILTDQEDWLDVFANGGVPSLTLFTGTGIEMLNWIQENPGLDLIGSLDALLLLLIQSATVINDIIDSVDSATLPGLDRLWSALYGIDPTVNERRKEVGLPPYHYKGKPRLVNHVWSLALHKQDEEETNEYLRS